MGVWKGQGYECSPEDMDHDMAQWSAASTAVSNAQTKSSAQVTGLPDFGSHFADIKSVYKITAQAVDQHLRTGAEQVAKMDDTIRSNKADYQARQAQASASITKAANGGQGSGSGPGGGGGGGAKYKHKLEGGLVPGHPGTPVPPEHPNNPADDATYDRLEALVNGLLEDDGTRVNALDTDDAFDQSQETVVAYTDRDGKVHVISTNAGQGTHATDLTISFIDEQGNMHVVTSLDGTLVAETTNAAGLTERREIAQGTLDMMMAEARDVNVAYTDDQGVDHVVSTDKDQGGPMQQVVVAYADEHGQQHMISNEAGIDAAPEGVTPLATTAGGATGIAPPRLTALPD